MQNTDDDQPTLIERMMATKVLLTKATAHDEHHPIILILLGAAMRMERLKHKAFLR
tara:strand:- start:35 stop:202 length:168 start_codon:yes stop_codon:yes gene_type:complete